MLALSFGFHSENMYGVQGDGYVPRLSFLWLANSVCLWGNPKQWRHRSTDKDVLVVPQFDLVIFGLQLIHSDAKHLSEIFSLNKIPKHTQKGGTLIISCLQCFQLGQRTPLNIFCNVCGWEVRGLVSCSSVSDSFWLVRVILQREVDIFKQTIST